MHPERQQLLERERPVAAASSSCSVGPSRCSISMCGKRPSVAKSKPRTTTGWPRRASSCASRASSRTARGSLASSGRSTFPTSTASRWSSHTRKTSKRLPPPSRRSTVRAGRDLVALGEPPGRPRALPGRRLGDGLQRAGGLAPGLSSRLRPRLASSQRLGACHGRGGLVARLGRGEPAHRRRGGERERRRSPRRSPSGATAAPRRIVAVVAEREERVGEAMGVERGFHLGACVPAERAIPIRFRALVTEPFRFWRRPGRQTRSDASVRSSPSASATCGLPAERVARP